jgi:hypothetical protein
VEVSLAFHDVAVTLIVLAAQLEQFRSLRGQNVLDAGAGDVMATLPRVIGKLDAELSKVEPDWGRVLTRYQLLLEDAPG